jgi:hypothetical protein
MNRTLPSTLAAFLAVGSFACPVPQSAWAEDAAAAEERQNDPAAQPATPTVTLPPGVKLDDDPAEDRPELFKTIGEMTEAASTKGGFDDFVERLVDQDRNRIGKDGFAEKDFADLDAKAVAIRDAWKAKYGEDLDVEEKEAFAKLMTLVGTIDDPQAVASAWPVPAVPAAEGEAVPAAAKEPGKTEPDVDSNIEKGRDVAIVTFPASHGLPALNVSMIQEAQGWRVDVPNTVTGQQLHDSLLKQLSRLADAQAQWPADKGEAALMAAHHVLLGAYGVDVQAGGDEKSQK